MNWRTGSTRSRTFVGFVALLVTVGHLAVLGLHPLSKMQSVLPSRRTVELRRVSRPETKSPQSTFIAASRIDRRKSVSQSAKRQEFSTELFGEPRVTAESGVTASEPVILPPGSSSSSPLRIDTSIIHSAVSSSKGSVAEMAPQSGQALPAHRVSASMRFSSEVKAAGKSDCLTKNKGGSLLSLPLIAYAAVSGRCK